MRFEFGTSIPRDPAVFRAALVRVFGDTFTVDAMLELWDHFGRGREIKDPWNVTRIKQSPGAMLQALRRGGPQLLCDARRTSENEAVAITPEMFLTFLDAAAQVGGGRYATGADLYRDRIRSGPTSRLALDAEGESADDMLPRQEALSIGDAGLGGAGGPSDDLGERSR